MKARRRGVSTHPESSEGLTKATYYVAEHRLLLSGRAGTWFVDVDESSLPSTFATEAEAWEAGVREVDRLHGIGLGQVA